MAIVHIVLFQFKADAKAEDVKAVRTCIQQAQLRASSGQEILTPLVLFPQACARFLALKDGCIHPTSKAPYIKSLKAGKDNSPEGLQVWYSLHHMYGLYRLTSSKNGMTHGFVVEFSSVEDRDYYVKEDPVHQAFVKSIGDVLEKPIVLDFVDGVY
jgi:hypothetical protein